MAVRLSGAAAASVEWGGTVAKPKVFVSRVIPEAGQKRIEAIADAEIWPEEEPPEYETLAKKVAGVEGLVCLLTDQIDAAIIEAAGHTLKVISQMAVGVDNIDLGAATARGIPVGHTPGVLTESTADFAFALLMAAARRVVEGVDYVSEGSWKTWSPTLLMGQDVHGATLGIIGFGRIGKAVARRASGFDMEILVHSRNVNPEKARALGAVSTSLGDLLARSDFVSLHVPLTNETRHMIDAEAFSRMKSSAVLVNTARGAVVDSAALYEALAQEEIAYAALDVTDPEPIPERDPLLSLPNCIIVPHIASSGRATRSRMASMAADNLEAGLEGRPLPHCANPAVYEEDS